MGLGLPHSPYRMPIPSPHRIPAPLHLIGYPPTLYLPEAPGSALSLKQKETTSAAKIITAKTLYKNICVRQLVCNFYKNTLRLARQYHKKDYRPFRNHYTHEIIIVEFKFFSALQLQLSGVCRVNLHCSYGFLVPFFFFAECSYRK